MTRRALVLFVAALAALAATVVTRPSPAYAQANLEVEVGYGDGLFTPGEPVPVRVRIDSDRLIRDEMQITVDEPGRSNPPISVPIEVSGGSNEVVVAAVPTPAGANPLTVSVQVPSLGLTREVDVRYDPRTELVGLLPDVVGRAPQPLDLPGELGRAVFQELDNRTLAAPGALDALGTIVAGPDGLEPLDGTARANVLDWLDRGGRLVVDAAPGTEVAGLPPEWQPGDAPRALAGRGQVALTDGAVGAGRWNEVVVPTPLVLPGAFGAGMMFASEGVAQSVGRDGGMRVPSVGWLGLFLVVYVLIVGPLAFLALRRLRRGSWTWLVVPLVAVLFATGAFVVGADLRSGAQASHGTVVHTGPAGARSTSFVALVSRTGEDGQATFPQGWLATGLGDTLRDPFEDPASQPVQIEPAQVQQSVDATVGQVDLDPGGVGMVTGWGSLGSESADGLEVTAEAQPDGSITGTVRNTTDSTLRDVLVMVGYRCWDGDNLRPGEEAAWEIGADETDADVIMGGQVPECGWQAASGWDGQIDSDTPVNYALWSEIVGQMADPYPGGMAVAAGWTRDWEPTIDVGRELERGRTAFVADAPVRPAGGALAPDAVRRELLRMGEPSEGTSPPEVPQDFDFNGQGAVETITRHTLPSSVAADGALRARFPATTLAAQVWDGRRWVPLEREDRRGNARPDGASGAGGAAPFDPWSPDSRTFADLPAAAVHDGAVLLRTHGVNLEMGFADLPSVGSG